MFSKLHVTILIITAVILVGPLQTIAALRTLSAARTASVNQGAQTFACLPKDVHGDEIVSYGWKGAKGVTVREKLGALKARCRNGKLVDTGGREIRFFRMSCWGNPPPDYLEIQQREKKELARLKKRSTVVVLECNPMAP